MIDLYTWTTPNGRKISIMLEELGEAYEAHAVDIGAGQQHSPEFLAIAPSAKIPAIRDRESGLTLMESGAILMWLAETRGRFLPHGEERWKTIEWLCWQVGNLGPHLGQAHQVLKYNRGKAPWSEEKSRAQVARAYATLETRLTDRDFIAGAGRGEYTIADMACWPWISRYEWQEVKLSDYPAVREWYLRLAARPAVQAGYHKPHYVNDIPMP
ncbi:glutathione S-transferase family protein [Tropicimonas sediminicola]|uniref:GST-like protein n=1 Tax=Tropicimonas sediminicola TaxID=1031541 RepID=A0A239H1W9_9RHOB|nr:glutathione S-transferase N-terminal domain-containing protein [Tropicimonas sediminicola]SNS75115.1 GST-like protein [Tropicimonas sediminicola]